MSPNGMCTTPPGSGSNGARYASLAVSAKAPMVRPWKAPSRAMILVRVFRGVEFRRASLNAASLASVPELAKNTLEPAGALLSVEQLLGQRDLRGAGEEVGDVAQRGQLAGDHRGHERVGVAHGVHCDAAEQVQVFLAVRVPDQAAGAADQDALRRAEDAHQGRGVTGQPLGTGLGVRQPPQRWGSRASRHTTARAFGGMAQFWLMRSFPRRGPPACQCPQ